MDLLQARLRVDEQTYKDAGEVSWATFYADPESHKGKVVLVAQDDFAHGTLRIRHPCLIKLSEDVAFNPNRPTMNEDGTLVVDRAEDWMPYAGQTNEDDYLSGDAAKGYRLGFFAAIAVEASNVIIDLNGYTLGQHPEHALMQRFFAIVELADQPFRSAQGPAEFGSSLRPASSTWIKNGTFGLSSHHSIHGNSCSQIWLSDLVFGPSEVASVSINGGKSILVERCEDRGRRTTIPVLGSWSALRFAIFFASHLTSLESYDTLVAPALAAAKAVEKRVFDQIIVSSLDGTLGDDSDLAFLKNVSGLLDGPAYGMVFHPEGVAVNGFVTSSAHQTGDIVIQDTFIGDVQGEPREIVALTKADGTGTQVDTVGAVFQALTTFGASNGVRNANGTYGGTVLSDLQIAFAKLKAANPASASYFGTLSIDDSIVAWAESDTLTLVVSDDQSQASIMDGDTTIQTYGLVYNGDSMHHVMKGVLGIRVEGASSLTLKRVGVKGVTNEGALGAGSYTSSHAAQGTMVGFGGTLCHGIRIGACDKVTCENVHVSNVSSGGGPATGLALHQVGAVELKEVLVEGVEAGSSDALDYSSQVWLPNPFPDPTGILLDATFVSSTKTEVKDLTTSSPFGLTYPLVSKGSSTSRLIL